MDIKGGNILFAAPDVDANQLYPCVKLADFGKRMGSFSTDGR